MSNQSRGFYTQSGDRNQNQSRFTSLVAALSSSCFLVLAFDWFYDGFVYSTRVPKDRFKKSEMTSKKRVNDLTYSLFFLLFGLSAELITGGKLATVKRFDQSNPFTFSHSCLLPTDAAP